MDDLRLALVLCGVVLVAAIYFWDTKLRRRRRKERDGDAGMVGEAVDHGERRGFGFSVRRGHEPVQRPELDQPSEIITSFAIAEHTDMPVVGEEPRAEPGVAAGDETPASDQTPAMVADDLRQIVSDQTQAPAPQVSTQPLARPVPRPGRDADDLGDSVAALESLLSDLPVGDELPADALLAANAGLEGEKLRRRLRSPSEELVIALTVMARHGQRMGGAELRSALEAEGLRYGDMQIFHHYGDTGDTPEPLFSVANAVNPGTFELDSLDDFETPGLTLFARVPETRGTARFDLMLSKAHHLALQLDADVCDDGHCTLTKQSANHIRERIVEYERRQRLG